ncbi:ATP-binding protein [Limosilactobacillus mucosae]|uniref:ATP-binding protein n=1 Tax=Limosilactobacillus mucosae TaxID=97478 RepID=UPI0022E4A53B|nr:ATP-binding protein [Limosilactobacillus mucosae]
MAMHSVAEMAASISANLKRIAQEKGQPLPVDLDNKDEVKAYMKANNDKHVGEWNQRLKRQKFDHVYKQSLWSGRTPIAFNFSSWDSSKQISKQNAEQLKQKAQQLAQQMLTPDDKPFNVMFEGSPGTGKTSLAIAMIDYVRHHGYRWGYIKHPDGAEKYKRYVDVLFLATDEMLELVYHSMDGDGQARNQLQQVVKFAKAADVLILDDFGTEGGMKGTIRPVHKTMQELMYDINNARFGKKYTIITTNNTVEELRAMYNVKLISRLIPTNGEHTLNFNGLTDVRSKML